MTKRGLADSGGEALISAALNAPLIGVVVGELSILHAVTMEAVVQGWDRGDVDSACGLIGLKLLSNDGNFSVPWPPRVATLRGSGKVRCRECYLATGRKRPRVNFVRKAAS